MAKKQSLAINVSKNENMSEWYTEVILKSGLIEYTDVSGCMIFRPRSYQIWENIQKFLDENFKKKGVENAYFPLFIPEKLLQREADHVEGFTPEVAWVTETGSSKLKERLAIRPTSETIMYEAYQKWIKSHRDLPLRLNQWCNVVRWEFNNPVPFLRTREFLWQEGHTAFATKEEAEEEVFDILDLYADTYEKILACPSIKGIKTEDEKFAGGDFSATCEIVLPNGKSIQGCTSHHLGQNFAKAFNLKFKDTESKDAIPFQNSWGFTTRSIGVMIMMHSDDRGLVIPPNAALNKGIIIPIMHDKNPAVLEKAKDIQKEMSDLYLKIDSSKGSPGFKFADAEINGYPFRIELGPKDLENYECVVVRRDTLEKKTVKLDELKSFLPELLEDIHNNLLAKAKEHMNNLIVDVSNYDELKKALDNGNIARGSFSDTSEACEKIKQDFAATKTLCKPLNAKVKQGSKCIVTGEKASTIVLIGRSY